MNKLRLNERKIKAPWNKGKIGVQIGYWKGKKLSEESKKKMSISSKLVGKGKWLKGIPKSEEMKKHLSEAQKKLGRTKEKSSNWKGGLCLDMKNYWRNWRLKNIEKVRFWDLRNKHNRRASEGSYTNEEWESLKKKCNYSCVCCHQKEPEIKLTIDHIIPIKLHGTNYIKNIQPLCKSCNSHKNISTTQFV